MNPILNSIKSDKSLYEISDKPVITIIGIPHSLEYFEINNQSGNIVFSHSIELPSTGIANYSLDISSYKVGVYSAIVHTSTSKVSTTFTVGQTLSSTIMSEIKSPLQQFKSGIKAEDIKCADGFTLVIKSEDGSPACVKPDTAQKLIERGWTKEVIANPIMSNQNSNQTVSVVSIKQVPPVTPGGPTIQLTLKNIGNMPITSLKVTLEVNKNYTFDFKDVTPTTPLVPNNSTSQTQILIGAGFQTDVQHPIIITGTENNTQFTYTENVYTQ